jgi:hypothetical protein
MLILIAGLNFDSFIIKTILIANFIVSIKHSSNFITVESRYNELRYNEQLDLTRQYWRTNFFCILTHINIIRYNEIRYNENLDIASIFLKIIIFIHVIIDLHITRNQIKQIYSIPISTLLITNMFFSFIIKY